MTPGFDTLVNLAEQSLPANMKRGPDCPQGVLLRAAAIMVLVQSEALRKEARVFRGRVLGAGILLVVVMLLWGLHSP